jgi:LPS O-antigen subunit length determinant protein (WzzB/FepE family)
MPERPVPNMPQTPSRTKLEADLEKSAGDVANGKGPGNLNEFIGEYLRNTNGLREFVLAKENYDNCYAEWYGKQAEHVAARQNHMDAAVMAVKKESEKILTKVELSREYEEDSAEKLDQRLEKIEKKLAKIASVNMAKTIETALSGCMEKRIDQLTERAVNRLESKTEQVNKREEI